MRYADSYVYTSDLDLDLDELTKFSFDMENVILSNFGNEVDNLYNDSSKTTSLHSYYNFLLFPNEHVHKLFLTIQNVFSQIKNSEHKDSYYITMWLNIHNKTEFLNWHSHNSPEEKCYHGYFCVNAEPSITMYRLKDGSTLDVKNKNNQLVISRSDGDMHCVTPWDESTKRITLAFDIVPTQVALNSFYNANRIKNWIPI